MFLVRPGVRLHVLDSGGEGVPLVMIHGFSLDLRMWDPQLPALAGRRVIRYDLRGFGRSSLPTPGETYAHADDLIALLDRLDVGRADLVGLSLGGAIAIDTAMLYPERVRRLVLIDSALAGYPWTAGDGPDFATWEIGKQQGIAAARARWMNDPLFTPEVAARVRNMVDDYSGWHWANDNPTRVNQPTANDRLADVRAPALVMVGEKDLPDFHRIARRCTAEMPDARLMIVPGAGHLASLEAPDVVNAALVDFLYA